MLVTVPEIVEIMPWTTSEITIRLKTDTVD
jgi:hypothetical protein